LTGYGYDSNGNLTSWNDGTGHSETWTPEGQAICFDGSTVASYDAFGRIVEEASGGTCASPGTTYKQFIYTPGGAKLALMNGQTLTKAFVPLPAGETAVYTASGLGYYRHPDWLGSSRLATSTSRALYSETAYAPFGENYVQSGTTDLSFTGQNQDTVAGLYDFMFREYSPGQGRWISPDPAGLAAVDIADPQSWNRYAYLGNSPLNRIDPDGQGDDGGDDGGGFSPLLPPDFGEGIGWGGSLAGVDINKYCTNDPFNAAPVPLCGPDQGGGGITIILGGGSGGGSGGGGGGGGSSNGGFGGVGSNPANNFPNGETLGIPDWLPIRPPSPWDFLPGQGCEFGPCSGVFPGFQEPAGGAAGAIGGLAACLLNTVCRNLLHATALVTIAVVTALGNHFFAKGGSNVVQNRQFDEAVRQIEKHCGRPLTKDERRRLHDIITKQGFGLDEIVQIGVGEFCAGR
jgi:RHS repeat-associated protein